MGESSTEKRLKEEKKQELQKAQDKGQQEEAFKSWLTGLRQRREVLWKLNSGRGLFYRAFFGCRGVGGLLEMPFVLY